MRGTLRILPMEMRLARWAGTITVVERLGGLCARVAMEVLRSPRGRRRVPRDVVLPTAQQVARAAEVHEVYLPDPASAGRFGRADRVLPGRERAGSGILDFVGVARRGILAKVRPKDAPQQGNDGSAFGHGSDGVLSLGRRWVLDPAELGRGQATHARALNRP